MGIQHIEEGFLMDEGVRELLKEIQSKLKLEGKKRVFEDGKELKSEDLKQWQDPEDFTREYLIDKILYDILNVGRTGPKNFSTTDGTPRKVDYAVQYDKTRILIEAKPINANLYDKSPNAAVNQIIGIFRLAEARDKFDFGIATDGLKWVFISKKGNSEEYDIRKDFNEVKKRIIGEDKILQKKMEDISKKFYEQYNDLLHGVKRISKEDCLVNSIVHVDAEEDREEIAQVVVDRLIFIKFLEAKGIIKEHVLDFLYSLEEHDLNHKLNQLFFEVMNIKEKERGSVDPHFEHIPYLNGSLFEKLDVEKRNASYRIKAKILHKVIEFLNKFKFVHHESLDGNGDFIDPEILGYIFERAMNATDRKGTGAYYTPKEITRYIAENTIYPIIINKVNEFLIKEKDYKKSETIKDIGELFILRETTLNDVWNKIILDLSICDNACGSGAFLLAAANVLFNLNKRINNNLGLRNSDVSLKKLVLKTLYGVDINSRAIEIALLRLWLWLVESYKPEHIEPLPNIEYNLRAGNSLIGYVDIEQFGKTNISLDDFLGDDETTKILLKKFRFLKNKYIKAIGDDARHFRKEIEEIRAKIKQKLDKELYYNLVGKKIKISRSEYLDLNPFHWGFEFYEVFDLDLKKNQRGFDVILSNPPYVRIQTLKKQSKQQVEIFKNRFKTAAKGNYDIYVLFNEKSLELLNEKGLIGYIQPHKFFNAKYGKNLRELLVDNKSVYEIVNFTDQQVFVGATTYTCLLFLGGKKHSNFKYSQIDILIDLNHQLELIKSNKKNGNVETLSLKIEHLSNSVWTFGKKDEIPILNKLNDIEKNLDSVTKRIFQGVRTSDDSVYVLKIENEDNEYFMGYSKALEKTVKIEKNIAPTLLKGEQMKRYHYESAKKRIIVPYEVKNNEYRLINKKELQDNYPFCWKYLIENKERLENRENGRMKHDQWYAYVYPKNIDAMKNPKIITADLANHNSFSLDGIGNIFFTSGYGILPDDNYPNELLLPILNSKLIEWYLRKSSTTFRGGYYSCEYRFIKDIPIKDIETNYSNKLIKLCDKALSGDKNSEKEIDEIIYDIYGLNKKEIEIIEKSLGV